jgi:hypothetical protein
LSRNEQGMNILLFLAIVAMALFFGLPYYNAYKRRQKLKGDEKRGDDERGIKAAKEFLDRQ